MSRPPHSIPTSPSNEAEPTLCDTVGVATPIIQDLDGVKRKPTLWLGLLVFAGYLGVFIATNRILARDFDYGDVVKTAENTRDGVFLPVLVASAYLTIVTTALGWWRPAIFEPRRRVALPKWMWLIPFFAILCPLLDIWRSDHRGEFTNSHWFWLIAGFALVGYSEELATRGLLLVGARTKLIEEWVAVLTAALFSLMHGLNFVFGQDAKTTLLQIAGTFPMGLAFYVCRRVSGNLIVAMVFHALYDLGLVVFGGTSTALNQLDTEVKQPLGAFIAMLLALVAVLVHQKKLFKSVDDLTLAS